MTKRKAQKRNGSHTNQTDIYTSPITIIIAGIIGILLGIWFIFMQGDNTPISRDEAIKYEGSFLKYESSENYCTIVFENDEYYFVHAHTEKAEFAEKNGDT